MPAQPSLSDAHPWLWPQWPQPEALHAQVRALMSTRHGGVSRGEATSSLNLRWPSSEAEDSIEAVRENRRRFAQVLGAEPRWLKQVHGVHVLHLRAADETARSGLEISVPPDADACFTTDPDVACAVMVADCLPVLLADDQARVVGAAHAGWRGLAAGVLQATVQAMCRASGAAPAELQAWLGPCIGAQRFEVGDDVRVAFVQEGDAACFNAHVRADGSAAWLADLPALSRLRLAQAGVKRIGGDGRCTVQDASDFFSHRASGGRAGRMAAGIVLRR